MNKKSISKVLKKKHEDFLSSIKDENVRSLVDKNSIITGGAITSMLLNEEVNDFDYYFTNKETVLAVANYYVKEFKEKNNYEISIEDFEDRVKIKVKSLGVASVGDPIDLMTNVVEELDEIPAEALEKDTPKYIPISITNNAITLSNKVQLIIRFYGEPENIHENYDFVHGTNYWLSKDGSLHLNQPALESTLARQLYYTGSLYPVSSVVRTRKFIKRGWHINAGQYIKMCFQISQLDLTDIGVLEDQLTGVDNSFFYQIIEWFKKQKSEDENFEITEPYLVSIIDKIF